MEKASSNESPDPAALLTDLEAACRDLISAADEGGGKDSISLIVARR